MQKPLRSGLRQTTVPYSLFFPACLTPDQFQLWTDMVSNKKKKKKRLQELRYACDQTSSSFGLFIFFPILQMSVQSFLWTFFGFGGCCDYKVLVYFRL